MKKFFLCLILSFCIFLCQAQVCKSGCCVTCNLTPTLSATPISCAGNDGEIQLYIIGSATVPYTIDIIGPNNFTFSHLNGYYGQPYVTPPYLLNNQSPGVTLTSGVYIVTFTDQVGCSVTASVTVPNGCNSTPCPNYTINVVSSNPVPSTCSDCNGSGTWTLTSASGSTPPFTGIVTTNANGQQYIVGTNFQIGDSYTSNVLCPYANSMSFIDANTCTGAASIIIPDDLSNCGGGGGNPCAGFTITVSSTNATNGNNGTITASAPGGGVTYSLNGIAYPSGNMTGLAPGTYTVSANSNTGCSASTTVVISSVVDCSTFGHTTSTTAASCGSCDGTIAVNVVGGATPYSTTIISNAGGSSASFPGPSATITNRCAGSYTVTSTDTNGCTRVSTAIVSTPTPSGQITGSCTGLFCAGMSGSGLVLPFTFAWSNGTTTTGPSSGTNANSDCESSSLNTMCVTITDVNGCSFSACKTLNCN